jgi:putative flippase GtrA
MNKVADDNSVYHEVIKFIIIGIFNTLLGILLMFMFYNFMAMGYWGSSAASYFLASIVSFMLNKKITFKNDDTFINTTPKFFINIAICYIVAYLIAKPVVKYLLNLVNVERISIIEQIALLFGICLFTVMNFFGQKYFVFLKKDVN